LLANCGKNILTELYPLHLFVQFAGEAN